MYVYVRTCTYAQVRNASSTRKNTVCIMYRAISWHVERASVDRIDLTCTCLYTSRDVVAYIVHVHCTFEVQYTAMNLRSTKYRRVLSKYRPVLSKYRCSTFKVPLQYFQSTVEYLESTVAITVP